MSISEGVVEAADGTEAGAGAEGRAGMSGTATA